MTYTPARGNTLLIPSGTASNPDQNHLFVVITDACPANRHLLVNLTSIRQGIHHDPTCIIEAGEHPFVTSQSYIAYRLARTDHAAHLTKCVDGWLFRRREDVKAELLQRICDGVLRSEFIKRADRAYFRQVTAL